LLMESWVSFSVSFIWPTAFTFILLNSERMRREPGTIYSARSRDPVARAVGDYVNASRLTGVVLYRHAGYAQHDRRKSYDPYPHFAGSRLCFNHQILSQQSPANHLLADPGRSESIYQLHQSAGTNHPANQN